MARRHRPWPDCPKRAVEYRWFAPLANAATVVKNASIACRCASMPVDVRTVRVVAADSSDGHRQTMNDPATFDQRVIHRRGTVLNCLKHDDLAS